VRQILGAKSGTRRRSAIIDVQHRDRVTIAVSGRDLDHRPSIQHLPDRVVAPPDHAPLPQHPARSTSVRKELGEPF
jgi:hypothetical protein